MVRVPELREVGVPAPPGIHPRAPRPLYGLELGRAAGEARAHLLRDQERGRLGPAERALRRLRFLGPERLAVRLPRVLLAGRTIADVAAHDDQARARGLGDRALERGGHGRVVVGVGALDVPAVGLEAPRDVLAEGERSVALDRDVIVVVEIDQVAEPPVARERGRLRGHALHQIAVGDDAEDAPGDGGEVLAVESRGQHLRGDREPDAVPEPLAERAGRGLDAGGQAALGMARGAAAELSEASQLLEWKLEAGEVEQGVEQHRGVSGREHEPVAVRPAGVERLVA